MSGRALTLSRPTMPSPFDPLRSPDRYRNLKYQFHQGCHWRHAVEHLLAVTIVQLNDGLSDLDVRHSPRLALTGRARATNRTLSVRYRNNVRKRTTVKISETDIQFGDEIVRLNDEGGVLRLVGFLVDFSEKFWNTHGRGWQADPE